MLLQANATTFFRDTQTFLPKRLHDFEKTQRHFFLNKKTTFNNFICTFAANS